MYKVNFEFICRKDFFFLGDCKCFIWSWNERSLNCLYKKANYLASGVECIKNCKDQIVNCRNVWF